MKQTDHLHILWTNADLLTAEKMVFMYGFNAVKFGWWENVTIIVWGATAKLVAEDGDVQGHIRRLLEGDVAISACKACADQLGVTDVLTGLGIEVKYWGEGLTKLIKEKAPLITV